MKNTFLTLMAIAATITANAQTDSVKTDSAAYWKQFDLGEVSVTAARKLIRQDIDKLTYDMARDEQAKTSNTLEMLRKVPMVTVDGQDKIRVKGSQSFKIYKNGHPDPSLEGDNASKILKAMPANTIKKIEVITEPGAKYDAEGTTMIINIVMKDNSGMRGVAGDINFTGTHKGIVQPGGSITAQAGKITLSANYGYASITKRSVDVRQHTENHYLDSGESLVTDQDYKGPVKLHFGNVSASYDIDSLNLVSLSGGGFYVMPDMTGSHSTTRYATDGSTIYSYDGAFNTPKFKQYNFNGRVDFQHKTMLDGEVLTLSYMGVATRNDQNTDNSFSNLVNVPFDYSGYRQRQREKFFEHTAQVDYVRPIGRQQKVELGAKYINRSNKSNTTMDYDGGASDMHSRFDHNTQVAAAYAEWMANIKRWSFRAGLRYEYSHMKATYPDGSAEGFGKDLNDWCPSASVQYNFDNFNTLSANFSTNINRPGIEFLNPARVETPTTITEGAPGLGSARNRQIGLTFMHVGRKLTFNINPAFYFSNNQIAALQGERDGKTWTSYGNVNRERSFYTTAFAQLNPWTSGSFSVNLGGGYHWYKNPDLGLDLGGWHANYNINYQQRLPWKLVFNGGVGGSMGREPNSVYNIDGHWFYHFLSLQRSFLKEDRLTVALAAQNPFEKHSVNKSRTVQGDYTGINRQVQSNQQFGVQLSYRFGSLKARVKTAERTINNDDVVGGIKDKSAGKSGKN